MAIPMKKNGEIRRMQSAIMGTDVVAGIEVDRCVSCGLPALDFKSELSRREFAISGLCQVCQDGVFGK